MKRSQRIVVRGGGDLATGVAQKLWRAGLAVVILETDAPTAIRRNVALCEAVYEGQVQVEDIVCRFVDSPVVLEYCWRDGIVPLLIDAAGDTISNIAPEAVVDAILAKRNQGTHRGMADVTIALGPGFRAGEDVDAVIETMRGHDLGRLILSGGAQPDTGVPGDIAGRDAQRVLHAPVAGNVVCHKQIGDVAREGDILFTVEGQAVRAPFTGLVRGMLHDGTPVPKGMKTADIDPRLDVDWRTISDKARCLGGAVLEAYFYLRLAHMNKS